MAFEPRGQIENQDGRGEGAIRTMKTDTQELLGKEKVSFLDMFGKENPPSYRRGYAPPRRTNSTIVRTIVFLFLAVAILGAAGSGIYWYINNKNNTVVKKDPTPPRQFLNIGSDLIKIQKNDRTGLLQELKSKQTASSGGGEYRAVSMALFDFGVQPYLANPKEFFEMLQETPPGTLLASFTGRWNIYMYGGNMILVFETNDQEKTNGSMVGWEQSVGRAFAPFIGIIDSGTHEFQDSIIKNIDARVAQLSESNNTSVGYAIVRGKYLIIATSETSLRTTIERFIAGPINE